MLKPETISIVKSTAPALREKGEEITTRMYEILLQLLLILQMLTI